jgi:hypothetical protein
MFKNFDKLFFMPNYRYILILGDFILLLPYGPDIIIGKSSSEALKRVDCGQQARYSYKRPTTANVNWTNKVIVLFLIFLLLVCLCLHLLVKENCQKNSL